MSFLPPNHQCHSPEGKINQWPGLILSSATTGLLTQMSTLPLRQLSDIGANQTVKVIKTQPQGDERFGHHRWTVSLVNFETMSFKGGGAVAQ